jgi:ribonuclease D
MTVFYHINDLPADVTLGPVVAIDSETMGLKLHRDRLCVIQLSGGDGNAHVVHFPEPKWDAPNLARLFSDPDVVKLFHFARFDLAMIRRHLGVRCAPVFCTKVASKLTRTNTESHSLKSLCKEFLDIDLSKQQQSSDWGAKSLSPDQLSYAASDVLYLHQLKDRFEVLLDREGRRALAEACFAFLPDRAELDLAGWEEEDIFAH